MLGIVMLQLNLHETDLLFRYFEDLHRLEHKSTTYILGTREMREAVLDVFNYIFVHMISANWFILIIGVDRATP